MIQIHLKSWQWDCGCRQVFRAVFTHALQTAQRCTQGLKYYLQSEWIIVDIQPAGSPSKKCEVTLYQYANNTGTANSTAFTASERAIALHPAPLLGPKPHRAFPVLRAWLKWTVSFCDACEKDCTVQKLMSENDWWPYNIMLAALQQHRFVYNKNEAYSRYCFILFFVFLLFSPTFFLTLNYTVLRQNKVF